MYTYIIGMCMYIYIYIPLRNPNRAGSTTLAKRLVASRTHKHSC